MSRWVEANGPAVGVLVVFFAIAGTLAWWFRRDRPGFRATDILLSLAIVLPVSAVLGWFSTGPPAPAWSFVWSMAPAFVMYLLALLISHFRSVRAVRTDAAEAADARAAIPESAWAHYASEAFRGELSAATSGAYPSPDVAADVIGYWAFCGLDSGDLVEWSRTIYYAMAIRGWRVTSPTLAARTPRLCGPFIRSADPRWDPSVDSDFRAAAVELLRARFGATAPA